MIFYKNHLKAHQLYSKNGNFSLNSGSSCLGTKVFSKAYLFFCCRYFINQSLTKKQHRFGIEHHLKKVFAVEKQKKGFATKEFFVDNANKSPTKKREKKRNSLILPQHIGRVFFVHNGKTFSSIQIYRKMLGHKFGEFASTRKKPVHKKKR